MNTTESPAELQTATAANAVTPFSPKDDNEDIFADPFILIEAESRRIRFDLKQLWVYRELLHFLVWRDIKIRYKQTLLGSSWAIIQPLFAMLLFTLIFGRLARIPTDNIPYPLFAYAGLLPWTFFANALTNSGSSLVGNSTLITKVYFPRVIIPGAAVLAGLLDFLIASLLLIPLLIYYRITPTWNLLLLPLFMCSVTLLALGVGMWLAALNVKYRDVRYALPFLVQLWLFASPVIYPISLVPERWRWVVALNPMTGIIEGFRVSLLGGKFDAVTILISSGLTIAILIISFFAFQRVEDSFADIV
ncbi:MAG TPA: ABC transporter permease [Pyrinomonadaceae bacterium]|jgi:lipopolysaccharide transport system permease protein|nr:ABC transporter permease [Pyrinomonadaceae bacterium]